MGKKKRANRASQSKASSLAPGPKVPIAGPNPSVGLSSSATGPKVPIAESNPSVGTSSSTSGPKVPIAESNPSVGSSSSNPGPKVPIAQSNPSVGTSSSTPGPKVPTDKSDDPSVGSSSVRFPLRPGLGQNGRKGLLNANHFSVKLTKKYLHQYDVSITPEVTSVGLNRAVMKSLVDNYSVSKLGKRLPAYDGRKSLYTAGSLPFTCEEFEITLYNKDDMSKPGRTFYVTIKFAALVDLGRLKKFLSGEMLDIPQEALQALDIVLRQQPTERYCPLGRSFYYRGRDEQCRSLSNGLKIWPGFYQSIRPTNMGLSLNTDTSFTTFIEPMGVINFVQNFLQSDLRRKDLSNDQFMKIKDALFGIKIEVTHRGNIRMKYRISGLTSKAPIDLKFSVDEKGTMKTVTQYFKETYDKVIKYPNLPCLQTGNPRKPAYLPMEFCRIVDRQRYSKRLNERQTNEFIKEACQTPQKKENEILKIVQDNAYHNDPIAREFGITVTGNLASVQGRVLNPPTLKYREITCVPSFGQWNMLNKCMENAGRVRNWICICFDRDIYLENVEDFCLRLAYACQNHGMEFSNKPVIPITQASPHQVESAIRNKFYDAMGNLKPQRKELDLLIVILPDRSSSLYGNVKRICDTDIGLISQCCLKRNVVNINKAYLSNVSLKINVKVGGRNTMLLDASNRKIPLVSDKHTIIFGADVTHPASREDSNPSIAAVVASQDWPQVTKYACRISAQPNRQELIQDLYKEWQDPKLGTVTGGMVKELISSFEEANGQKPERIIFYRDGVGEGQFNQVLSFELGAIKKACASMEPNYQPPVTLVVVQKRHHTKLFPIKGSCPHDKNGNMIPGTVVDTTICHPTQFDFYLCSHAGIKGTSRPTHYHVLHDENGFSADQLQTLTFNLCFTYARCTRSVSIVPPAYYAHLAAYRARFYMNPETPDGGSAARGAAALSQTAFRPLREVNEKVKRVMYYC